MDKLLSIKQHTSPGDTGTVDPEKGAIETSQSGRTESLLHYVSRSPTTDSGPPPDGGLQAWLQVLFVHLSILNSWGLVNSYGVFQSYYVDILNHSPSDVSWVGSFQIWLLFAVGVVAGRATDAGYFKLCLAFGSVLLAIGIFATSLCTQYWQFFLAQGVCQGVGYGFLFIPVLTVLPAYFDKHRVFAFAITACGTATGGMIYPAIIESLLPKIGFQWTLRVIGFIVLGLQLFLLVFLKHRTPPRKSGPLIEWSAFREPSYSLVAIGVFLVNWGVWFAFYYIPSYAGDVLHTSPDTASYLLLILNGLGIPGRLIPAFVADRYTGPLNMLAFFGFLGGIVTFTWAGVSSLGGLEAWCVIYGFCSAGFLGLFPATVSTLTEDPKKMGVHMGMVFSILSFACLTGPPIAGALIQKMNGDYLGAQIFAAVSTVLGGCVLVAARIAKKGWVMVVKV